MNDSGRFHCFPLAAALCFDMRCSWAMIGGYLGFSPSLHRITSTTTSGFGFMKNATDCLRVSVPASTSALDGLTTRCMVDFHLSFDHLCIKSPKLTAKTPCPGFTSCQDPSA